MLGVALTLLKFVSCNIGALTITYIALGVPRYNMYNYIIIIIVRIMGPKTLF